MRWSIIDANEGKRWAGITDSVVAQWLAWEIGRARGCQVVEDPAEADAVFLVLAGSVDYLKQSRAALRAAGALDHPCIVTGGPVDATPRSAMAVAHVLCVGEAYRGVRLMLRCRTVAGVRRLARRDPHMIDRQDFEKACEPDPDRPWLNRNASLLAEPDSYIDWDVPSAQSDDRMVRVVAGKGCHKKCSFCATTYRQRLQERDAKSLVRAVRGARAARVGPIQILSNDGLHQPGFRQIRGAIAHQSLTAMELMDDDNLRALIRARPSIIRVGMEGVSERIRLAFGKPVKVLELVDRLALLHANKVHTHTFWITHSPFENREDWKEWTSVWDELVPRIEWGMHRAKMTCFQNSPPAPLMRFIPPIGGASTPSRDEILQWRSAHRAQLRRVIIVAGSQSALWKGRIAEQTGVRVGLVPFSEEETVDLAPSFDDFERLPSEVIRWPIKREIRYRISDVYQRRMQGSSIPAAVAA